MPCIGLRIVANSGAVALSFRVEAGAVLTALEQCHAVAAYRKD